VAVQDQGPGIPLADRDRIFQRHVRLHPRSASHSGGLGLGLYIARRLATAHRGQLQLAERPGAHGARFELRLPLAAGTPCRGVPSR
jgi:signal transduction histidine kinase